MKPVLDTQLKADQLKIVQDFASPAKIQAFLDSTTYSPEEISRCPLQVLQDRLAHCLDGGLFAAAMLRRLGYPPLVVDIWPDPGMDDDHVLAVYRRGGYWGAVAKSNYVGLRFREPVYRSLRELVMSYFEDFYNTDGVKTLRSYTRPLNLARFDRLEWMWRSDGLDEIINHMNAMHRYVLVTPEMAAGLSPVDQRSFEAGRLGVNPAGLFIPGQSHKPSKKLVGKNIKMITSHSNEKDQPSPVDFSSLPAMPKVTLGRTGIISTRIGLGTASWPLNISYEQTRNVLQTAFDCGIRHIDMAPYYGSEETIGRALQEIKMSADTVLATKACSYLRNDPLTSANNFSADTVYRSVERSLKRLGVSYLHIVHIHNVGIRHLPAIFAKNGALSALLDLKSQGVIGSIGMATLGLACQLAAVECGEIDHIQAFHTCTLLNQTAKVELFPKARAAHLSVLNNAPYAGYILATGPVAGARYNYGPASPEVIEAARRLEALCAQKGVSLPTAAVAFSFQDPEVDVTVIASGKPLHVISWVKDLAAPLTRADFDELIKAAGGPFPVE